MFFPYIYNIMNKIYVLLLFSKTQYMFTYLFIRQLHVCEVKNIMTKNPQNGG